jgi:hypothetical protein
MPALGLLLALLALPAGLGQAGVSSLRGLRLHFGPGDGPYVSGFLPEYEINDARALHWSRRQAVVTLPLVVSGGPGTIVCRFGPPPLAPGEEAEVEVTLDQAPIDRFTLRRGGMQERRIEVPVLHSRPLTLGFSVRYPGTRDLGLWMDWLDIDLGPQGSARLNGGSRVHALLTVAVLFVSLCAAGWSSGPAALLTAPASLGIAIGVWRDPWLTQRLLTGVPETLTVLGVVAVVASWIARKRFWGSASDSRVLVALVLAGFLLRALVVNTPGYYHPDLRSHAKVVLAMRKAGPFAFWTSPVERLREAEISQKPVGSGIFSFPYPVAFHFPFVLGPKDYDALITAFKLYGAALSMLPVVFLWILSRTISASPLGAALLLVAPIYGRHLVVAFLPALLGHACDTAFLAWLAGHLRKITRPRYFWSAAVLVAICQLAYSSAVPLLSMFVAALTLAVLVFERDRGLRPPLAILGFGLAGSLLSVLVYYRHFLGLVPLFVGSLKAASSAPVPSSGEAAGFLAVALGVTRWSFALLPLALAAGGLVRLFRAGKARPLLAAWLGAYVLALLARTLFPTAFQFQHEALFLAPLVFLAAGEALVWLWSTGRLGRVTSALLLLVLVAEGAHRQWADLLSQLDNAL